MSTESLQRYFDVLRLILKRKLQLNRLSTHIQQFFGAIEQVSYWSLVRQHSAHNSQGIERCPLEFTVVLDNGYQATT